jgi:diketogulonate reductase-like aldo/keto reductase
MVCLPQTAQLSVQNLSKIKELEKELGVVLIAYQPMEYAELSDKQVKELQKVEKSTGATVIAYR